MKKIIVITTCWLVIFPIKGQPLGEEQWVTISHEVNQLVITNEDFQLELDSLLFCIPNSSATILIDDYKYFHLYVREEENCQILEFRLSNYPYKTDNLIGYFLLKGYPFFVHCKLPDFLVLRDRKISFSYIEHRLGDLIMMEDDTPCWIIEYKESHFKMIHYSGKLE